MARWLSFTNHKLYQCRLLLQQAEGADHTSQSEVLKQALTDGALYLLRDAYLSYLHELAELATYRQPVQSLSHLLSVTPLITGEMREFKQLEADPFSWLSQLLKAVDAISQAAAFESQVPRASQPGVISLMDTSEPEPVVWLGALSQLIDLQRENRQES